MNDIDLDKPVNQIIIGGLLTIAFTCFLLLLFIHTPVYSDCWSNQSGIGCSFGVLDSSLRDSEEKEREEKLIEPDESIPKEYINSSLTSNVSVSFERNTEGNQILERFSHDAMITKENDTHYLIVGINGKQILYKSQNITNKSSWKLADGNYLKSIHEGDDIIRKQNQLVVHSSYSVYTTNDSIEIDNWTSANVSNYELEDGGIYYDEDEDMYHFYYEKGSKAKNSGIAIGHAVSPNGVDNWTIYPEVWNASDTEYGVGDFDVVEVNNTVVILGDYDRYHPKYSIAVWANSNPYTEFEKMDGFALEPRDSEENFSDDFGVSDPELVRTEDGFVMFANGHRNNNSASSTLQMYKGDISVE